MWKKFSSILLTVLLCLVCAVASAQAAEDSAPRTAAPQEKPSRIELVMILDKSGSMHGLEADTIGGFNAMIEKEKKLGIDVRVTTVLFNDRMDRLYEHREIRSVRPLTERTYETGGTTALLDAVGDTILHMEQSGAADRQGTKVIVVIITDGMENASTEFTKAKVKELISDKQEKAGWDFIYLGANIDAVQVAGGLGIRPEFAAEFACDAAGVRENFASLGAMTCAFSAVGEVPIGWAEKIGKHLAKKKSGRS